MKIITLVKNEVIDGVKVQLGQVDHFPVPESLEEMIAMMEDGKITETQLVACFVSGWRVRTQAQIASGADPKSPVSVFKKVNATKQAEILAKAKELGLL